MGAVRRPDGLMQNTPVKTGRHSHELWAGLALTLAAFVSLLALDRPLARGDGLAYYMWLEPIACRLSFDLTGPAAQFAAVNEYQIFRSPTGALATAFSFGPAIMLAPWYRLALLLPDAVRVDAAHYLRYQGDAFIRSFFVLLGSNFYTITAVLLSYKSALLVVRSPWVAALAAFALLWATPLIYYGTVEPYMAHATGTFLIALALWLYTRPRVRWLILGVTLSVAVLVRWQLALLAIPLGVELLWRRRWGDLLRFGLGTASLAWLVPLSWYQMFGQFLVVPAAVQNSRPFLGPPVHVLDVLLADEGGLFIWSPLTLAATVGLVALWRKQRGLAAVALVAFALQVFINAGVSDFLAGWTYGMRRLTELYPFFVVGLAYLLSLRRQIVWPLWGIAALLLVFSIVLLVAHLVYINYVAGYGASAPEELARWFATLDNPRLTWQVIKEHYGPWAWTRPGP